MNKCLFLGKISGFYKEIEYDEDKILLKLKLSVENTPYPLEMVAYEDIAKEIKENIKMNDMVFVLCYAKRTKFYNKEKGVYIYPTTFIITKIESYNKNNIKKEFNIDNEEYADESLLFNNNDNMKGVGELLDGEFSRNTE